jgi:hypothetical protein
MTPREKAIEAMARAAHDAKYGVPGLYNTASDKERDMARAVASAALDALLAELPGMGLLLPMPVVATDEMINALNDVVLPSCVGLSDEECNTAVGRADYAAMCAAAPNVLGRVEQ